VILGGEKKESSTTGYKSILPKKMLEGKNKGQKLGGGKTEQVKARMKWEKHQARVTKSQQN